MSQPRVDGGVGEVSNTLPSETRKRNLVNSFLHNSVTVKSRAVNRISIQTLSIFGMLVTEMYY